MEIIVGKTAGFCYGVKRAVDEAEKQINENERIYCLGEIVHNQQVVDDLEKKGIVFVENIEDIKDENAKVIIRAHGVESKVYEVAKEKNIEIIDCTCPMVLKIHNIAEEYRDKGYYILLTGKASHPEVIGIISNCGENYTIIESEDEVDKAISDFEKSNINKLLLISQTTYNTNKFEKIKNEIEERLKENVELVIKNTICSATGVRQKETGELAKQVDAMIIIGGKNSSNTRKLYEISKEYCEDTICIETKDELDVNNYKNKNRIGIMAGASTPIKSIEEVVDKLNMK